MTSLRARPGFTFVEQLPDGHKIVGMIESQGSLYVATDLGVFRLVDGELKPIRFEIMEAYLDRPS